MTTKKYASEKAIKDKIQQLFAYRKLTELLAKSGLQKDKRFTGHLIDIQFQIYLLDAYLEAKWTLDKNELKACWNAIINSLATLNYTDKQIKVLIQEIKEYERIEMNCRNNKWPTRETFRKFYLIKSCDVRLIRHLIYDAHTDLNTMWKEDAWRYYDRITEINDDIADVTEDLDTYNGNRFLISILRKGTRKTHHQYQAYLENVMLKAKGYFKRYKGRGENSILFDWTMTRGTETLTLLEKTMQETDPALYSSSVLVKHME